MNTPIRRLFVGVVVLFAVLVGASSWWSVLRAEPLQENRLNRRELLEQQRIRRGEIRARDGDRLARDVPGPGETFRRDYAAAAREFAHAVGYSFITTGRAGLEASRNDELSGERDDVTSFIDELRGRRQEGDDVVTALDPVAQRVALQQLAGRPGAVVALDPRSGGVRVMASVPGFDPQELGDPETFAALNRADGAPLFNRATQSGYPPGSTFKVVTAIAAIESGRFTPASQVSGRNGVPISGVPLNNSGNADFGTVDLTFALTNSINTVWAQVAEQVGKERMGRTMERLGFGADPPLDYPDAQMRASGEYVRGRLVPPTDDAVDVGRMGIGQDKLNVTPLQMAMVASAVANGGTLMRPQLARRIVDRDGRTVERIEPEVQSQAMRRSTAERVTAMMADVVREGTGTAAALSGIEVAGKTGTAETSSADLDQVWFIAFAPVERPRAAVAVTVERSPGQGGTVAAPIARAVLQALLR